MRAAERLELLSRMPKGSICAEIGVWKGVFSRQILEITLPSRLYLIDPWLLQPEFSERLYGGRVAKNQRDMDRIYEGVRHQLERLPNVSILRGFSEEVLAEFSDGYFDWLYIDGNHEYEYVLKDLELAFLKIRPGGLITGDDYTWTPREGPKGYFPVKQAVQQFIGAKKLADKLSTISSQFIISK